MHHHTTTQRPVRVALIGFGAIGSELFRLLQQRTEHVHVCAVLVRRASATVPRADSHPICTSLAQVLERAPEVVVECAGHQAVDAYGETILRSGKDFLLASAGALADRARHERLCRAASASGRQLLLSPGAVGGLDVLAAARAAGLHEVTYRSRKPPLAWLGTPAEHRIDLAALREPAVVFRGSAREAASKFPRNANAAATVALASMGLDETQVILMADPQADGNIHEIEAHGPTGHIAVQVNGRASASNPKTSAITAYSLVRALLNRRAAVVL